MRIGLLADIHDDADRLAIVLAQLDRQQVDQIVALGDTLTGMRDVDATGVVGLLRDANVIGVWGNHDFGLCHGVTEEVRGLFDPSVLDFMGTLQPQIELDSCFFSHVEPWLDPHDIMQLWYYDGPPDTPKKAARSFAAVPNRFLFLGHFHHWLLMTPNGQIPWRGTEPIRLGDWERCLIIVAPVFEGHCAVFDTERTELTPLQC